MSLVEKYKEFMKGPAISGTFSAYESSNVDDTVAFNRTATQDHKDGKISIDREDEGFYITKRIIEASGHDIVGCLSGRILKTKREIKELRALLAQLEKENADSRRTQQGLGSEGNHQGVGGPRPEARSEPRIGGGPKPELGFQDGEGRRREGAEGYEE